MEGSFVSEPTQPIVEQIADAIAAQLATITVANGYRITVAGVVRPTRMGHVVDPIADKTIVLSQGGATRAKALDHAGNPAGLAWTQDFQADCYRRSSDTATTPVDQLFNIFAAECQKAIMADPQWGGLALLTDLTDVTIFEDITGGMGGVIVGFAVTYRVKETDPYAQA